MHFNLIAYAAGAIVLHFTSWLPPLSESFIKLFVLAPLFGFGVLLFLRSSRSKRREGFESVSNASERDGRRVLHGLIPLCIFVFSYSYALLQVMELKQRQLKHEQTGVSAVLYGSLCSIPRWSQYSVQFEFCVAGSVSQPDGKYLISIDKNRFVPTLDACWQIEAKLKPPRASHNAWADGYERHLFSTRILARGNASYMTEVECDGSANVQALVTDLRRGILVRLESLVSSLEHKGLIYALVLGDRSAIDPVTSEVLRVSGTQHLIAISGLHVGLVCWALYAVLSRAGLTRFSVPVIFGFGLTYIVLVGFSASAQRALIMLMCALYVLLGRTPKRAGRALLLALVMVLMLDPLAPLSPGFWFSFVAVAVLLALYFWWPILRRAGVLACLIVTQILITLCLLLIQDGFSMPVSAFSFFANLVAIPWVSIVVLPLCLIALPLSYFLPELAVGLLEVSNFILDALVHFCSLALEITVSFYPPGNALDIVALVLVLVALLFSGMLKHLRTILVLVVAVFFCTRPAPEDSYGFRNLGTDKEHGSKLVVVDAGQGLSIFARAGHRTMVYDTGPAFERFSVAKNSLRSLLLNEQVYSLDSLILSHGDADHASDAPWLAWRFQISQIIAGERQRFEQDIELFARRSPASSRVTTLADHCFLGQEIIRSPLRAKVLWPSKDYVADSSNNRSCIILLQIDGVRFLLMGDLEGRGERAMLEWYAEKGQLDDLQADVLVAGHHGAQKASSFTLLKHVRPRFVVFSAGYANRFGHPSRQVQHRVRRIGSTMLSTAHHGSVEFSIDDNGKLNLSRARDLAKDYWVQPSLAF